MASFSAPFVVVDAVAGADADVIIAHLFHLHLPNLKNSAMNSTKFKSKIRVERPIIGRFCGKVHTLDAFLLILLIFV